MSNKIAKYTPWIILIIAAIIPDTEILFGFDILTKTNDDLKLPESFEGPLLANQWLSFADHLFKNEICGPESFASWNGNVYASIADGRIIQILADSYRTVAFLNPENRTLEECRKIYQSSLGHCSRPLGIKFSSKGLLYAIDPYHGIFEINVGNGFYRLIMDIDKHRLSDGGQAKFLDDLILLENDNDDSMLIYLTDASQKWLLHDVYYTVGELDQTGRLLLFDTANNQLTTVMDNLAFPNGLILNKNKTFILINEFNKRRILRYYLPKNLDKNNSKKYDIFVDNLPGEPDNIKHSLDANKETYWIGLFTGRNRHRPSFCLDIMANHPYLKRAYFRIARMIGFLIESIGRIFYCDSVTLFGYNIRVANFMYPLVADYGMAIEIDSNGAIIDSLHSPNGHTTQLSELFEYYANDQQRHFYIGSYSNEYLGRIIVPKNNNIHNSSSSSLH